MSIVLLLDSDTITKVSLATPTLDLDDRVNLRIEPLDMDEVASECIGKCDDTSLPLVCTEFSGIRRVSIAESYEVFYKCVRAFLYPSSDLIER